MSFMPPDMAAPEQAQNGGPPPEPDTPPPTAQDSIDACLHAIRVAADQASTSQEPEAIQRLGNGAFMFAQSVEKLMPQKPSPDTKAKLEADMVRQGSQMAHDEQQKQLDREHQTALKDKETEATVAASKEQRQVQITRGEQ